MKKKTKLSFRDVLRFHFGSHGVVDYIGWIAGWADVKKATVDNLFRYADKPIGKGGESLSPRWATFFIWASRKVVGDDSPAIPNQVEKFMQEALAKWKKKRKPRKRKKKTT